MSKKYVIKESSWKIRNIPVCQPFSNHEELFLVAPYVCCYLFVPNDNVEVSHCMSTLILILKKLFWFSLLDLQLWLSGLPGRGKVWKYVSIEKTKNNATQLGREVIEHVIITRIIQIQVFVFSQLVSLNITFISGTYFVVAQVNLAINKNIN